MAHFTEYLPLKATADQAAWLRKLAGPNTRLGPVIRACIEVARRHQGEVEKLLRTERV